MAKPYFTRALFSFLKDLAAHNDRAWFNDHRDRYEEHYRDAGVRFVADFGPQIRAVSPHLVVDPRPHGGSLLRIFRDIRFKKDKRPYKTHVGMSFAHESGKGIHAPGIYLHLEPGGSFVAGGLWRPPTAVLRPIRQAMVAAPDRWRTVIASLTDAGYENFGEQLQRVPAGFPGDHPLADELRWKSHGFSIGLTQQDVLSTDAHERIGAAILPLRPYLALICEAIDQPF